jgi:hypothetical protein
MVKHSQDEGGGKVCIETRSAIDDVLDTQTPGKDNQGSPSLVYQNIAGIEDAVDLVPTGSLGSYAEYPAPSTP